MVVKMHQMADLTLLVEVKIKLLEINQQLLEAEIPYKEIKTWQKAMTMQLKATKILFKEVKII